MKKVFYNLLENLRKGVIKTNLFKDNMADNKLLGFLGSVQDGAIEHKKDVTKPKKPKKVMHAMLMSYQGKNYFGMQKQKIEATIESHILDAMKTIGVISEEECLKPNLFWFQRAARTDRAVSAVGQICSMQLPLNQDFIDTGHQKLNEHLPKDIRVMSIKRTTPSFHAQKTCDARTYSYTLPTFTFAEMDKLTTWDYRISENRIDEINDVLASYLGTHNFFNYTSKKEHDDRSCYRYIKSFECTKPFLYHDSFRNKDVEFITVYVKGQSFILHQIRKMMGMVISVVRGLAYKSDILKTFESKRMDVPRAPGLGLLLEKLHYDVYSERHGLTHSSLNDWGDEVEKRVQSFRDEYIVSEILSSECQSQQMMQWLSSLIHHRFASDPRDENGESHSAMRDASHMATFEASYLSGVPPTGTEVESNKVGTDVLASVPEAPEDVIDEEGSEEPEEKKAKVGN